VTGKPARARINGVPRRCLHAGILEASAGCVASTYAVTGTSAGTLSGQKEKHRASPLS